jgi:hypothetical protein
MIVVVVMVDGSRSVLDALDRPFGSILVFTSDAHAHRQLLHTGYHEKV